jgi:hypothetical protein
MEYNTVVTKYQTSIYLIYNNAQNPLYIYYNILYYIL